MFMFQIFLEFDLLKQCPSVLLHTITIPGKGVIRGIDFDPVKNFLIIGEFNTGKIYIYDLEKPGRVFFLKQEKFAKLIAEYTDKINCRQLIWSRLRNEIFIGNTDGTVSIVSAKKGFSIC